MILRVSRARLIGLPTLIFTFLLYCYLWSRDTSKKSQKDSPVADATEQIWPYLEDGYVGAVVFPVQDDTDAIGTFKTGGKEWLSVMYFIDALYKGENTHTIPRNKGNEAMVYLTYIIENYNTLPPYALFIHGHTESWHQMTDIYTLVRDLRLSAVDELGYVSLRCGWHPSCPVDLRLTHHDAHPWGKAYFREATEYAISDRVWPLFFPGTPMPDTLASPCCAQFAVTRAAIKERTKEDYIRMRQWLLDTDMDDEISGRVFEKLWSFIMTGQAVNCPSPQTCSCEFFGNCEKQKWEEPPPELGPLPEDSRWP